MTPKWLEVSDFGTKFSISWIHSICWKVQPTQRSYFLFRGKSRFQQARHLRLPSGPLRIRFREWTRDTRGLGIERIEQCSLHKWNKLSSETHDQINGGLVTNIGPQPILESQVEQTEGTNLHKMLNTEAPSCVGNVSPGSKPLSLPCSSCPQQLHVESEDQPHPGAGPPSPPPQPGGGSPIPSL